MTATFHKLKVKKVKNETLDCVSVSFEVPENLVSNFGFKQGQYLTLRQKINDEEIRRSYSISTSPFDQELQVAVKKVPEGLFSTYVNDSLKEGDYLDVMAPQGRFFTETNPTNKKSYVAFVAGSGITPVISIIKTILKAEPDSRFTLIYGNKNKGTIIFKSEIEDLKNLFMERFSVYHILSRETADAEVLNGRIDKEKSKYFLEHIIKPEEIDECFLCGPEEMINNVRESLTEAGVDSKKVHFELFFSTTAAAIKQKQAEGIVDENDPQSKVTIKLDASSLTMDLGYHGETILDAALRNGADLPFACKGGVCATCRAKVETGKVHMDVNYSLEPDEVEAGFILTCQSHPRSEDLVVNFDIK